MKKRNTVQKKAIFSALAARCDHPSASRLYEDLRESHPNLSRATVYRVLNAAADEGQILRIHAGTEDHFDAASHHCHIVCSSCDAIFDAPFPQYVIRELEEASGYAMSDKNGVFYGLCPSCQEKGA